MAPRVQPHEELPEDYEMPEGSKRWLWVLLDEELADLSDLSEIYTDPERAEVSDLRRAMGDAGDIADEAVESDDTAATIYKPDKHGYIITLPDKVETRLRYRVTSGRPVAEIRVANRHIPMPPEHNLNAATRRVLKRFEKPNRRLTRDDEAANRLAGLQALYDVKASCAADRGEDEEAASWGATPWKLGVQAGLLVAFDVFVGQDAPGTDGSADDISVPVTYIERARANIRICHGIREAWRQAPSPALPAEAANRLGAADAAFFAAPATDFQWPLASQVAPSPPATAGNSQSQAAAPAPVSRPGHSVGGPEGGDAEEEDMFGEDSHVGAVGQPSALVDAGSLVPQVDANGLPERRCRRQRAAPAASAIPKLKFLAPADFDASVPLEAKRVDDGVSMETGYGPGGASAQVSMEGAPLRGDRYLMQRAVLRGSPVVYAKEIIDATRVRTASGNAGAQRKAVTLISIKEVMVAGFQKYPVGKFVDGDSRSAHIVFAEPPLADRNLMMLYHNMLIDLCQVSLEGSPLSYKTSMK